jgi:hypothetical protein
VIRLVFSTWMRPTSLACLLLAFTGGCDDEGPPPVAPAPLTDPQPQPRAQAAADERVIERIADATCDREQSCNTIGPGAYFASREECMNTVREKTRQTLSPTQCPGGILQKALDNCLASLVANQCAQPGDEITRAAQCPARLLCIK